MKRQIALLLVIVSVITGVYFFKSQSTTNVTIEAYYMQYACGDDNIDMKVDKVDHADFQGLIDRDIAPFAGYFQQSDLVDFVNGSTLRYQTGKEEYLQNFTIVGRIRSDKANAGCDNAVTIFVDKIKYGKEEFKSF